MPKDLEGPGVDLSTHVDAAPRVQLEAADGLDHMVNPHPRMWDEAIKAWAKRNDSSYDGGVWRGFFDAMRAATGYTNERLLQRLHEEMEAGLSAPGPSGDVPVRSRRVVGFALLLAFMATIPLANAWLHHFGFWRVPALGPVASGVIWVGLAFVLRDVGQILAGRAWAWVAIAVGTVLSIWLASPALAVASGAAFAVSETMDALIYTPLADRMFLRAVIVSGWVGSLIDSAVFVRLAFHSYTGWWQLGLVKAAVVALATPAAYGMRRWVKAGA